MDKIQNPWMKSLEIKMYSKMYPYSYSYLLIVKVFFTIIYVKGTKKNRRTDDEENQIILGSPNAMGSQRLDHEVKEIQREIRD